MSEVASALDLSFRGTVGVPEKPRAEPGRLDVDAQDWLSGLARGARAAPVPSPFPAIHLVVQRDLEALAGEWRKFEASADCTPFQTYAWLAKWQKHIGVRQGTRPAVIFGYAGQDLLFILPLAVETRGTRRLTWLGSDLCDYNAPLLAAEFARHVDPAAFPALWGEAVRTIQADPELRFDLVDLPKMPECVGRQGNPFLLLPVIENPSGAHVAELGPDWEAFYSAKRSSSVRKQERKQFRRLGDHGAVQFADVHDPAEVERTLDTLFQQKSRSFARMGVEDVFAKPGHGEFFRDVATDRTASDIAQVTRLDIGSIPAAVNFGLMFRSCFYLVISSYHDGDLARFGPGRAHLRETLRHAIAQGCRHFDFTIGDEPYKTDWSDTRLVLYDHLAGVTPRGRLAVGLARAFRRVKKAIKANPTLWRGYTALRARSALARGASSETAAADH